MTIFFYILAAIAVVATLLCITERHAVHAIVYLVTSFFSLAVIFYLLSAPLVAVFEVIIYAGAIMVLFLFIIMMLKGGSREVTSAAGVHEWLPASLLAATTLIALLALVAMPPSAPMSGSIDIAHFAKSLFTDYGVAVEIISLQLLFAVVGAFYLGRRR